MYDEFERAVGGNGRKRGPSPLVWFGLVFGFFVVTGVLAVGFAVKRGVAAVQEAVRDADFSPAREASRLAERLERHTDLLRTSPGDGLAFLRRLDANEPGADLLGDLGTGPIRDLASRVAADPQSDEGQGATDVSDRRTFTLRAGDGDLRIDLDRGEDGGSLVIGSGQESVRFDLVRRDGGGFLTIDTGDEQTRVDLLRTEEGGSLLIDGPDGRVRFDLSEREGGGSLVVRTDGEEVLRLGVGEDAVAMPRWVPEWPGMPPTPRPVYSLIGEDGILGAVSWDEDARPDEVVDFFARRLEDEGYDLDAEARNRGTDTDQAALWARHPDGDRMVFVLVHRDRSDGVSKALLGYGEGR